MGDVMKKYCVAAAAALSIAAAAVPGTAEAAVCAPNTTVCVTGVEENVAKVIAFANATKATAEAEVAKAQAAVVAAYAKAYYTAADTTSPIGRGVLNTAENPAPVCGPAVAGLTPICVTGVGTTVAAFEAAACNTATYPAQGKLVVAYLRVFGGFCPTPTPTA
jgi:hypothetical protein